MYEKFSRYLIEMILNGEILDRQQFQNYKVKLCKDLRFNNVPANSEILKYVRPEEREKVIPLIQKKPMRTLSGVAVVAVMASPYSCPHGRCIYCPGGVENNSPQSYTGKEPAARRAKRNEFDPYRQVIDRIKQLEAIGHATDKIDLIIMGGTFTCRDEDYQEWFVKRCFDAMNNKDAPDIDTAHTWNEVAKHRCVGLTLETRPDVFDDAQIERSLRLGITRVEMGVQILNDDILKSVNRGHGIKEVIESTQRCKNYGLVICYHIMPGLPGSSPKKDLSYFCKIFDDPDFRPDMLKLYTTLVIEGTELYDMWKSGKYEPYDIEKAITLIADMKRFIPEYARVQRIQRDIPAPQIAAGILNSNIRQLIEERLCEIGRECVCIRCREIGRNGIKFDDPKSIKLDDLVYQASGGEEHFISYTYQDKLIGYIRLRLSAGKAIIRDLKVFGRMTKISNKSEDWQHSGFGKKLVMEAERVARSKDYTLLKVISGVGARGYYKSLGYRLSNNYMIKQL